MATLVEGREYGLSSNVSTNDQKTCIHFKLTDSALRALEEYSKIKESCSQKPTIHFTNNSGVMNIPGQVSSSDNAKAEERSFKLTLANLQGVANGSFDCIQQISTRQASGLHCLGSMQYKVTTHANNDVYTDTRKKIAIADNESKKICAKEIKMSSRFRGKMVKKVIPSSQYKPLQASRPTLVTATRPSPSAPGRVTPPPSRALSPHQPFSVNHSLGKSLVSSNGVLKLEGQTKSKQTSGVINMPYRDRVIHLLALRSYKKPELLARLMKDGIREKDRNSLGAILKQVSVMNKDNSHSLARHAWQNVRADWPFYTEADRELLKKNQQQQDPKGSAPRSVSPAVHPADRGTAPLQGGAHKRNPVAVEDTPDIPTKKQRISHQNKQQQQQQQGPQHHHHYPAQAKAGMGGGGLHSDHHPAPHGHSNSHHYQASLTLATRAASDMIATHSPSSNAENQDKGDNDGASPPDYLTQYTEIENCSQRKRYKEDFNSLYQEYRHMHKRVESVSQKFRHFKERILNAKEGTQEFDELYDKVMEEYERHKDDAQFWQDKRRLNYLHAKLGRIKGLIVDFDTHRHPKECR
ncbi:LOW QUALITY PROTEIN: RNA polymerase II elongation factor ELL-like [Babylonia areolata]|uniref:LOW QUALITY PROTEIN: RNA polymerase II elongation factor ELL-like n=1 Tax=Babylonia areolata TaxID=304850 RepID=UPI003FD43BD9